MYYLLGSSGEVFQKAVLSLSSDIPKDAKSKQKRKERLAKPKTSGQKVRGIESRAFTYLVAERKHELKHMLIGGNHIHLHPVWRDALHFFTGDLYQKAEDPFKSNKDQVTNGKNSNYIH